MLKLIWTYSKKWRKSNNTQISSEYIEYLYKKSFESADSSYKKILYTDEESKDLFKDYVDEVKIIKVKKFTFLADLKFHVLENEKGEFCCIDGDFIIRENIVFSKDIGFEFEVVDPRALYYSDIFLKHSVKDVIPYWDICESSYNLGLMYFNNDSLVKEIVSEYKKVQKFFNDVLEPKYIFNEKNEQVSICGSQYWISSFLHYKNIKPELFCSPNPNDSKCHHLGGPKKLMYYDEWKKSLTKLI